MADTIDILNIQPNKVTKDLKGKYIMIYVSPGPNIKERLY